MAEDAPQFDDADLELEVRPMLEKDIWLFCLIAEPVFERMLAGVGKKQGFGLGQVATPKLDPCAYRELVFLLDEGPSGERLTLH